MLWIAAASVLGATVFFKFGAMSVWVTVQMWLITALLALLTATGIAYVATTIWRRRKNAVTPRLARLP